MTKYDPVIPCLRIYPKKAWVHAELGVEALGSFISNSQGMEAIQIPDEWVNALQVKHP